MYQSMDVTKTAKGKPAALLPVKHESATAREGPNEQVAVNKYLHSSLGKVGRNSLA